MVRILHRGIGFQSDLTRRRSALASWTTALSLLLFTLGIGCNSTGYRKKQDIRNERIKSYYSDFLTRESKSKENLEAVRPLAKKSRKKHAENLRATQQDIEKSFHRDLKQWQSSHKKRVKESKKLLSGKPETISKTIEDMLY